MQNLTLSITQLNNYIKNIFDSEELLIGVSVYGEVTNFKISNGIAYFDIKEEGAQLSCVKFSCYSPFAKNGDQVVVTGRLNYHVKLGKLSFVASKVEPYGVGALYKQYLELKARLEQEGLFDQSKKKEIPKFAHKIGVVTSETGAVIRDIYNVTRSKNPFTDILVYPSKVQGAGAEDEIVEGIKYLNTRNDIDVIIVARGGGSFEDLMPFNTEKVARAVFESALPVISAVGHETDFTLIDFAADLRTPTPSVAAEVAVFNYFEELQLLDDFKLTISKSMARKLDDNRNVVTSSIGNIVKNIKNMLDVSKKDIESFGLKLSQSMVKTVEREKQKLQLVTTKLEKSNPLAILKSGYAIVEKAGENISDINDLSVGDQISIKISNGEIVGKVEKLEAKK
ncbi:MAG: exodeoxyribonuclease VII large subunit [Clostridia bacterium]|nr:exodeoxyribonuclease VII large subunit [Clostridia bacterium]